MGLKIPFLFSLSLLSLHVQAPFQASLLAQLSILSMENRAGMQK